MGIGFGCGAGELHVAHRSTKYWTFHLKRWCLNPPPIKPFSILQPCSSNRESCNLLGLILAISTVYVGSTPPPRIPVTTRIVNMFDRESLQAICLKTTGWGVRSDVFFPMRDFPWTWREDPLLWTRGWSIGDSGDDFWEGNGDCQSCMISIPKCPIQGEVPMALESLGKPVVKPGWNHEIFWSQGKRSD